MDSKQLNHPNHPNPLLRGIEAVLRGPFGSSWVMRCALFTVGGLAAAVMVGIVLNAELPDTPRPLRSVVGMIMPSTPSDDEPQDILRRGGDLALNAGRAADWLRSRGVEQAALPAAAQAYRLQYGHALDEDLDDYGPDVEAWLIGWQAAYRRGEPWARAMVNSSGAGN